MKRALHAVLLTVLLTACSGDEPPVTPTVQALAPEARRLLDVTQDWGLSFVHERGATDERQLPETMGHGAALFDADEDGDLDLYVVQGGSYRERSLTAPTNRLFANDGGRFRDVTPTSGAAADPGYGMGVAVGDGDGDGHADLYLTNFGLDRWLTGDGTGAFVDATEAAGIHDDRWTTAVTYFDPDADGDLDLFVAGYVAIDVDDPPWCGRRDPAWRTVCHPDQFEGLADRLWINDGRGRFTEESVARGVAGAPGKGLGVVAIDVDDDGWTDLYVANDSVENHLWRNLGDGRFEDGTLLGGVGVNRFGATEAGMGVAAGDLDDDLDPELIVTNFDHESHTVYRNEGQARFSDATPSFGIEAATRLPVGFGVLALDLDLDRDLDLAVLNGHIVERVALYDDAQTWRQAAQVFTNVDGRLSLDLELGGELVATPRVGRCLVAGDLDGDGDEDLVATECGGRTRVFENRGPRVATRRLDGLTIGTRVRATYADGRVVVREAGPAASYLGSGSPAVLLPSQGLVSIERRVPGGDWR
ncbi:MAG: VCBS repeat-containing protein [Planctomycetota bacterium]